MGPAPASVSVHFHTLINIFNCVDVPQAEWKIKNIKYTKLREYTKLLKVILSGSFSQAAVIPCGNQRKNNNHRFRQFIEQLLTKT